MSFFTLYYSSLWRTDTIVFAKVNKPGWFVLQAIESEKE